MKRNIVFIFALLMTTPATAEISRCEALFSGEEEILHQLAELKIAVDSARESDRMDIATTTYSVFKRTFADAKLKGYDVERLPEILAKLTAKHVDVAAAEEARVIEAEQGDLRIMPFQPAQSLPNTPHYINHLIFNEQGTVAVTTGGGTDTTLWDTKTWQPIRSDLHLEGRGNSNAQFSADGSRLLLSPFSGAPSVFDVATGKLVLSYSRLGTTFYEASAMTTDGKLVASTMDTWMSHEVIVWGVDSKKIHFNKKHLQGALLRFSPDDKNLLISYTPVFQKNRVIVAYDAATGKKAFKIEPKEKIKNLFNFKQRGERIIAQLEDGTIRIWSAIDGHEIAKLDSQFDSVVYVALSPDNKQAIIADSASSVSVFDTETGKKVGSSFTDFSAKVTAVAIGPGGWAAAGTWDGVVTLWHPMRPDVRPYTWQHKVASSPVMLEQAEVSIRSIEFSPDGREVFTFIMNTTAVPRLVRLIDPVPEGRTEAP